MVTTTAGLDFESVIQHVITVDVIGLSQVVETEVLTVDVVDVNEPHDINNLPNTTIVDCAVTAAGDYVAIRNYITLCNSCL